MSSTPQVGGSLLRRGPEAVGRAVHAGLDTLADGVVYLGGLLRLVLSIGQRLVARRAGVGGRLRLAALTRQMVRVGVRAIPIVVLVQIFIGIILALNMAPVLESYGQLERVADIVAIATFRELGPLITAILLSGFAGASIAAELAAMVEGEELKAMRAMALDPVRFLVAPRVIATTIMMVGLAVIADIVGVTGGLLTGVFVLDLSAQSYIDATRAALTTKDYYTGLAKAGVFGLIVSALACYEGLRVQGGAEGVGRSTTTTVVKSIVALIAADTVFTAIFYVLGW